MVKALVLSAFVVPSGMTAWVLYRIQLDGFLAKPGQRGAGRMPG